MDLRHRILCALPFVLVAIGLALLAVNVPFSDDYDAILGYLNHPWPERISHILDFHNEHRIVATRLVSELVYRSLGHIDFRVIMWIGNIGWWLFAACFAYLFIRRGGLTRCGAIFATLALVGYYDHENIFWAMASIQNHWVVVFAFASCLAFVKRNDKRWFAVSLLFAVAATYTSGSGLLTFPSLVLMACCDHVVQHEPFFTRTNLLRVTTFCLFALLACGLYLHGLPHNPDPDLIPPSDPVLHAKECALFFFCFFGNLFPTVMPAFMAGICVALYGLIVSCYFRRFRGVSLAVFAFMAFCIASIVVATIFRGGHAHIALAGRYRLISSAIHVSLIYLTLAELPFKETAKKALLGIAFGGYALFSAVYLVRGVTYNYAHGKELKNGLALWPQSNVGLDYSTNEVSQSHASKILRSSTANGVYAPRCRGTPKN